MSWVLAFCGFALLIILHELGHFAVAKAVGMRVERFMLFFPPILAKKKIGETEYGVGAIPLGGYVKISGMNPNEELPEEVAPRAYYRQPVWKRVAVISAGPAVNIVLAFIIFWVYFVSVGEGSVTSKVDKVRSKSPAARVLTTGDRIVAVNGVKGGPEAFATEINKQKCSGALSNGCVSKDPLKITVDRSGKTIVVTARPVYDASLKRMILGFNYGIDSKPVAPLRAAETSVSQMWSFSTGTLDRIARIFDSERRKELSGVVGAYEVTRQTFNIDTSSAIFLLGVVSLSLGVINLLPFLPLDGGHIFWALMEKVRGRTIPISWMERASFVGFALVITLFAIGFTNDVGRLTGPGFGSP